MIAELEGAERVPVAPMSRRGWGHGVEKMVADEVAFEAADCFAFGLAVGGPASDVGGCWRVPAQLCDGAAAGRAVLSLAVAAAVEAVAVAGAA